MRKLLLIGIGAGDPEHVTVQAVKALNRVDVFFALGKGGGPGDLTRLRREICERYIEHRPYRFVEVPDPPRDRDPEHYGEAVEDWTRRRAEVYERVLREELDEDGCGAVLVWGDPSLYDGALRVADEVAARGSLPIEVEVIPGVTSVQALAARHRITLNRVGRPVLITTGRLLAEGLPDGCDDVVVMLDGRTAFAEVPPDGVEVFWGANLGTEGEVLVSGPLAEVAGDIDKLRRETRERRGWVMDVYLLRRTQAG